MSKTQTHNSVLHVIQYNELRDAFEYQLKVVHPTLAWAFKTDIQCSTHTVHILGNIQPVWFPHHEGRCHKCLDLQSVLLLVFGLLDLL